MLMMRKKFRRKLGALSSKKLKGRKIRSSSDVRDVKELRDDIILASSSTSYYSYSPAVGDSGGSVPPSPGTPPSSPPVAQAAPTSRRKKIWNSFRSRTRRLRGKSRDKEGSFCESSGDATSGIGATDEDHTDPTQQQQHHQNSPRTITTSNSTITSSSLKKKRFTRSDTMRTGSTSDTPRPQDEEPTEDFSHTSVILAQGDGSQIEDDDACGCGSGIGSGAGLVGYGAGGVWGADEASEVDNEDEVDSGITLMEGGGASQPGTVQHQQLLVV